MTDAIKKIEAILFAVGRAITEREISQLALVSVNDVHHYLKELKKQYEERQSPLMLMEEGDAWKLTVHEKYLPTVQQITPHTELGKSILETLAVIAWKQPAKQSDVIKIRTTKAYEHIGELEKLGFISKEKSGRSFLIKVTGKFFDYFDLPRDKGMKEIFKDIKDVEEAVQTKFLEQGESIGLETYGVKPEVELEKEGKEHVDGLEVYKEGEESKKPLRFEEDSNPVQDFIKENKKLAPQEEELLKEKKEKSSEEKKAEEEIKELAEEETEEEKEKQKEIEEEKEEESEELVEKRELDPELENLIKKKEKKA